MPCPVRPDDTLSSTPNSPALLETAFARFIIILLCAMLASSLTSLLIIACASICKSISVLDSSLFTVILISLFVASCALVNSSTGFSNTTAVVEPGDPTTPLLIGLAVVLKSPTVVNVYETILTFLFSTLSNLDSSATTVP